MRSALFALICLVFAAGLAQSAEPLDFQHATVPDFLAGHLEIGGAFHDGILHLVTSDRDKRILHTQLSDGQWTSPVKLAYHRSFIAPALTTCDGVLHMVQYAGDFQLSHSLWDGRTWSEGEKIPDIRCRRAAALTGCDGALHLVHQGKKTDSHKIWYAANAGWGWGHSVNPTPTTSRNGVGLAGFEGALHMVTTGSGNAVWHTSREAWGPWQTPVQVPGAVTRRDLSLVAVNGRLYCFFAQGDVTMREQAPVAYSVYEDDQWSMPVTVEGFVSYGDVLAVKEPGLPEQIHLILPAPAATVHLWTEFEAKLAPMQMKPMKRGG